MVRVTVAPETKGLLLGLLAVMTFSATLPATRVAVAAFDPLFVGMGRAVVAACIAAPFLFVGNHRRPTRSEAKSLAVVALGVVVGFPIFTAWAMVHVDASHGGVMLGVLPLATTLAASLFAHERPSAGFWVMAIVGSTLVVSFALMQGGGAVQWADLALIGAVVCAAIGYAEGARLTRTLGGLRVISWALVLSAPILLFPVLLVWPQQAAPLSAWLGFAYVSVVSQYLGFLPWYRGMALAGVARVGQTQLLQPFFTIVIAAFAIGETIDLATLVFAVLVFAVVGLGRYMRIARPAR